MTSTLAECTDGLLFLETNARLHMYSLFDLDISMRQIGTTMNITDAFVLTLLELTGRRFWIQSSLTNVCGTPSITLEQARLAAY